MPYSRIHYVKLFTSLLDEDDRFLYKLNESQQLLYLKMLMLAGLTGNSIPKEERFIFHKINYAHDSDCFNKDIQRISQVFPHFRTDGNSFHFDNFGSLHNYITKKEKQRNSKGTPKELQRIVAEREIERERETEIERKGRPSLRTVFQPPSVKEVDDYCKSRASHVNPQKFVDFYASKGWMVGKNKMIDWKASVRTWENKENKTKSRTDLIPDL